MHSEVETDNGEAESQKVKVVKAVKADKFIRNTVKLFRLAKDLRVLCHISAILRICCEDENDKTKQDIVAEGAGQRTLL